MHSVSKYLIGTHMISHLFGIRVSRKEHTEHRKRERERASTIDCNRSRFLLHCSSGHCGLSVENVLSKSFSNQIKSSKMFRGQKTPRRNNSNKHFSFVKWISIIFFLPRRCFLDLWIQNFFFLLSNCKQVRPLWQSISISLPNINKLWALDGRFFPISHRPNASTFLFARQNIKMSFFKRKLILTQNSRLFSASVQWINFTSCLYYTVIEVVKRDTNDYFKS